VDRRVLIIDDSQAMNQLLARFLQNEGFLVTTISDPRQAMTTFEAFQPDLVLLDLNMPHLNGWELCQQVKDAHDVPVVIFSVRDEESDIDRAFESGADDYLIKPFEFPDLLQRIMRLLAKDEPAP